MPVVTLVSGGLDSLVMAKIINRQGEKQVPLFIDYGQLAAKNEWEACKKTMEHSNLPKPLKIDVSGYGKFFPTGITNPEEDIKKSAFLPGRNLLFLLIGSSLAYSKGVDKVAIGLLAEKYSIFPDQNQDFVVNSNFAINSALNADITIATPLIQFNKADVVKLAEDYKLPIKSTYSCHSGKDRYCGQCVACEEILNSGKASIFPQFNK